jgi:hypothetical protein
MLIFPYDKSGFKIFLGYFYNEFDDSDVSIFGQDYSI